MKFDFYLSEMAVSDLHGGGLTLQRVLGNQLNDIPCFIHVNRFATDLPVSENFAGKSINLPSSWDSDKVRKVLGRTLSAKISKTPAMIRQHARYAATVINNKFKRNQELCALVCPQGANAIYTLHELQKHRPVKYITWVMDDHIIEFADGSWRYPRYIEPILAEHLRKAEQVFVISPAMQEFYKSRFGVQSTVLFGSSNVAESAQEYSVNINKPLRIGYFGAVANWQRDALIAVADALKGTDTELHIYSGVNELPGDLQVDEVHFNGRLAPNEVQTTMHNYDALLLPISFKVELRNMSEFNIATKMSEYLACGVPIIAVGPAYSAMIKYLDEHKAAITVSSTQKEDIVNAISLLRDQKQVSHILKNAQDLVKSEVSTEPMLKKWLSVINS
jgi:glycosyltransferase involved in cell wall biosynthesis